MDYSKLRYLYLCNFGSLMTRLSFNYTYIFDPIWSQLQEFIWCVCLLCRINFYLTFAAQLPYYVTAFKVFKEPSEMSSKGLVSLDKILTWDIINLVKLKIVHSINSEGTNSLLLFCNGSQIGFCCKINSFIFLVYLDLNRKKQNSEFRIGYWNVMNGLFVLILRETKCKCCDQFLWVFWTKPDVSILSKGDQTFSRQGRCWAS